MAIRSPSGSTALDTVAAPAEPDWVTRRSADARARDARVKSWEPKIIGLAAVIVFFAAWQGVGWIRATSPDGVTVGPITFVPPPPLFLPTPVEIVQAYRVYIGDGKIWKDVAVSGQELRIGRERAGEVHALLHAAGELRWPGIGEALKPDEID